MPGSAAASTGWKPCGGCCVVITHVAISITCLVPGKAEFGDERGQAGMERKTLLS
jgi:hypothetical protein